MIKDFVVKTLVEKVGTTRTVKNILEIMTEKYMKTTGERIIEVMKKISSFSIDNKVDMLIDRFEEMVTETKSLRLAERLDYALSLQLIDRLETGGKINSREKMRQRHYREHEEGAQKIESH